MQEPIDQSTHWSDCSDSTLDFLSSDDECVLQNTRKRRVYTCMGIYDTKEAAKRAIDEVDGFVYKFSYNYGKREGKMNEKSVYQCISHLNCDRFVRLCKQEHSEMYRLDGSGSHGASLVNGKKRGIAGFLKQEVDDLLHGCGPKKCRKILLERYARLPERLDRIPSETQLKNRKTALKRAQAGMHHFIAFKYE